MIEFATVENYPLVQEIWRDCFGDNKEFTDFIFSRLIRPDHVLTWNSDEGKPVAMLCFQPCELRTCQKNHDAVYVFGVATLPEWRKRGISTALLQELQNQAFRRKIAASVLVPAGEDLFRFYGNQGYKTAFYAQKLIYTEKEIPIQTRNCSLSPLSLDQWVAMRDCHYRESSLFLRWSRDYLEYIVSETQALGGDLFEIKCEDRQGFVVCYPYKEKLIVKELALDAACIGDVIASLHEKFVRQEYHIHLPSDMELRKLPHPGQVTPFAMVKWHDPEQEKAVTAKEISSNGSNPYIAHVLDGPTLGAALNFEDHRT